MVHKSLALILRVSVSFHMKQEKKKRMLQDDQQDDLEACCLD